MYLKGFVFECAIVTTPLSVNVQFKKCKLMAFILPLAAEFLIYL